MLAYMRICVHICVCACIYAYMGAYTRICVHICIYVPEFGVLAHPPRGAGRLGSLRVHKLLYLIKFYTNVCCLYWDLYDSGSFCLYKILYVSKVYIVLKVFLRLFKELYVFLGFKTPKPWKPHPPQGGITIMGGGGPKFPAHICIYTWYK